MSQYFLLQFKITNRKLTAFGLHPALGYILLLILFIGLSLFLFSRTDYAAYFYGLFALSFVSKLSETHRNDFLKTIFNNKTYLKLRIIENSIYVFPFIIFLAYKQSFVVILALIFLSIIMALNHFSTNINLTIPTPFSRRPFEFIIGFRNTYFIFPIAYFIIFMAITVDNFNLGISALILVALVSLSYYGKPENEYFVWCFDLSPKAFLIEKIKTGLLHFTLLSVPIILCLGFFFASQLTNIFIVFLLCYAFITTIILMKYSAYPDEMSLPQAILFAGMLFFPPVLIVFIPILYKQSIRQLKTILI